MAIQSFKTLAEAKAVYYAFSKAIWHDINRFVVYTDTDIEALGKTYQLPPTQDEIDAVKARVLLRP
jgi:hypothetical protein